VAALGRNGTPRRRGGCNNGVVLRGRLGMVRLGMVTFIALDRKCGMRTGDTDRFIQCWFLIGRCLEWHATIQGLLRPLRYLAACLPHYGRRIGFCHSDSTGAAYCLDRHCLNDRRNGVIACRCDAG
jgi:hypothetical protein